MQTTNQSAGNVPPIKPVKEGHGCFFYGCITSLIIMGLIVAAVVGVGIKLVGIAKQYTSEQPMKIETVQLSPERMADLNSRIAAFQQALKEDKPARLILTADDINAKICSRDDLKAIGLNAHVDIEGDKITAAISMPFPIKRFGLQGRYINGNATVRTSLQMGRLLVFVDSVEVNGKKVPEQFMNEFRSKNLAENAMNDPETAAQIAKFKAITVQDGTIIVEK